MKLTPHEKKILDIVKSHPEVVNNAHKRKNIAKSYGLSEKTLRNRIAELKKRELILSGEKPKVKEKTKTQLVNSKDEINLHAIWNAIKSNNKIVASITSLLTFAGLIYSLLATIYFESTISMYPAGDISNSSGNILGDFQGLAKSFGLGGLGAAPTYNIPDIIDSRRLKKDIVLKKWKTKKFPDGSNLIKYWELDKPKLFSPRKYISQFFKSKRLSL